MDYQRSADDIVRSLRSLAVVNPQIPNENVTACRVCGEAADAIEGLTERCNGITRENEDWRKRALQQQERADRLSEQLVRKNAALQTVATFIKDDPIGAAVVDVKSMQCLETFIRAAITDD